MLIILFIVWSVFCCALGIFVEYKIQKYEQRKFWDFKQKTDFQIADQR